MSKLVEFNVVCHSVPLIDTLVVYALRATNNQAQQYFWLDLMLLGGAFFGLVDHLWNGELFLISELANGFASGVVITLVMVVALGVTSITPVASTTTVKST